MPNSLLSVPIPLCEPNLIGNEKQYVSEAIDSNWLSGGRFLELFEKKLSEFTGASYVVGVSSGTTALHVALILAGVETNDLVLVPNLTFVATANSVKYTGADPVLIDIDPHTWVMDLQLLTNYLADHTYLADGCCFCKENNRRIKAILPVHLLGNMCDMQRLLAIADKYCLTVIEDAACSLGSFQNGKHSGTFGLLGTLSFNSNKVITTGGGGAILTNDASIAKKARHLITQAKSSATEYFHDRLGYNYRLVNPLAAIGSAQMEVLAQFLKIKQDIAQYYIRNINLTDTQFQKISLNTISNFWHFAALVDKRNELITCLKNENIESRPLWVPINELPIFSKDIYISQYNHSKYVATRGIMLPCSTSITNEQLSKVSRLIKEFIGQ